MKELSIRQKKELSILLALDANGESIAYVVGDISKEAKDAFCRILEERTSKDIKKISN